jgi:hypothetical protein
MDIYIYNTTAVLGIFTGFIFGFVTGVRSTNFYRQIEENRNDSTPLERLKNALLTFALVDIKKEDMSKLDYQYEKYNGDKFPALSGSSVAHACYTYIFNRSTFKKSIMYSKAYESKLDAIEKYLNLHLKTEDQTMDLFEKFCEKHTECILHR